MNCKQMNNINKPAVFTVYFTAYYTGIIFKINVGPRIDWKIKAGTRSQEIRTLEIGLSPIASCNKKVEI